PHTTPSIKPKNVDLAATVLDYLGVPRDSALDGQPITQSTVDPFDGKWSSLQSRVDETGIPSSVKGWTQSFPAGWSVDNTGMGTGGVTEWRGWSLSNDEFWTYAQRDQGRETNVRARGVFAVADSDEWADKSFSGTFNSTLVSPAYTVTGWATAKLSY